MTNQQHLINNRHERMIDVLRAQLYRAKRADFAVSFARFSGTQLLLDALKDFVRRGGRLRLLTSDYLNITQRDALCALEALDGVTCRVFLASAQQGFHAKIYLFDDGQAHCWVGSSNLSRGGLSTNLEANLRHDDPHAVQATQAFFEHMWQSPQTIPLAQWHPIEPQAAPWPMNTPQLQTPWRPNEAQVEALAQLEALRQAGETRAVVIAATGVGKTLLSAFDAKQAQAKRILFISHRLEHLYQAKEAFERIMAQSVGLLHSQAAYDDEAILCATVISATNALIKGALRADFDYVIIDEFHHAAASSYQRLLEQLKPSFLLGMTATPERADGHDVLAICDYNIAYDVRLIEAIERQWLLPFHYFGIADEAVDYEQIPWRNGQFDPSALEAALMIESRARYILAEATEHGYDGPRRVAVGFCAGVKHARHMATHFTQQGQQATYLTGADDVATRRDIYAKLQDPTDPLEWLFVSDLLNEGVDLPAINTLLFLRPTASPTIFLQQLGRGLRRHETCEVLTVLDFVGQHRLAWAGLMNLNAQDAPPGPRTLTALELTPPMGCEIILDDRTMDIMAKLRQQANAINATERCLRAYQDLRQDIDLPMPIDLYGREDMPEWSAFRNAFKRGGWMQCREAAGDACDWEVELLGPSNHPVKQLFLAAEKDWQQQRVHAYALFWALCQAPSSSIEARYEQFFERFPHWRVEYKPLAQSGAEKTARKHLKGLLLETELELDPQIHAFFGDTDMLRRQIEGRLRLNMIRDHHTRHLGVLKTPAHLKLHYTYSRPEVVRHFGHQFDPARHNQGVLVFDDHIALIARIDTSNARDEHQYTNRVVDARTMIWQSQNKQQPDRGSGQKIVEHQQRQIHLHMFVQPDKSHPAFYLGTVRVQKVEQLERQKPMTITMALDQPIPPGVLNILRPPQLAGAASPSS